jgi:hypothetical protein
MTTSTTTAGTTMRAIIQENYGEAENVLWLGQTGRPAIGDREVLLQVHAAGVDRGVCHLVAGLPHAMRLAGSGRPRGAVSGRLTGARPAETPHLVHGPRDGRFSRLWRASQPPAHPAVVVTVVFRSPARRCHAASVWPTPSGSMRGRPEAPRTGRTVPLSRAGNWPSTARAYSLCRWCPALG